MKNILKVWKKIWGYEKVLFGYEKKLTFENFRFHTLGYEKIGCFFLMPPHQQRRTSLEDWWPAASKRPPHNSAAAKTPQPIHTSPGPSQNPHTQTQPTTVVTTQPKPRSGPHYWTEFGCWSKVLKTEGGISLKFSRPTPPLVHSRVQARVREAPRSWWCCLLVLDSVTYTPQCICHPRPRVYVKRGVWSKSLLSPKNLK
jgi:hypothetical protein